MCGMLCVVVIAPSYKSKLVETVPVAGVEAEAILGLAEGVWWGLRMSLSGTVGDVKVGAEGVGVAGEEAGVAAGGAGPEAEEEVEAEGDSLRCVSYWQSTPMSDRQLQVQILHLQFLTCTAILLHTLWLLFQAGNHVQVL